MKKHLFTVQGILQIFVGLGAVVSGALLAFAPSGALLQMTPERLKGTPFNDFLIPGIILVLVNGIGQILAGIFSLRRHPFAGYLGAIFGLGLVIWIFVQVNMIGGGHVLQYSYFAIGVVEIAISFLINGKISDK
jgi:hypothetical protein